MATHSSILAWRIPWTEGPGGLQYIGSQRIRHNWSNFARTQSHTPLKVAMTKLKGKGGIWWLISKITNIVLNVPHTILSVLQGFPWQLSQKRNLPAVQEIQVQSLGQKDPLEKEMANHSTIRAWKIPWAEEPGGLQFTGSQTVEHNWVSIYSFNSCYNIASPLQSWGNKAQRLEQLAQEHDRGLR